MQDNENLESWLLNFFNSHEFQSLYKRFANVDGAITAYEEIAVLYELVKKLKPKCILEIGTFFGHTAKALAEALYENNVDGRVVTIDPYGEHRMPSILQFWPKEISSLVDFKPWNSMQYFIDLKEKNITKNNSGLGMIFIDGDHGFEAALFDIMRSSTYLQPGGVMIVDNLEQEGPRRALEQFLKWNPSWSVFLSPSKTILKINNNNIEKETIVGREDFGILISPLNFQVSPHTTKIEKRNIKENRIHSIIFHIENATSNGTLDFNLNYASVPYDHHLTGIGYKEHREISNIYLNKTDKTLEYKMPNPFIFDDLFNVNINYEMELKFRGENKTDYVLLNKDTPFEFV